MTTYISILRGINVSGHRIIKMDALKQLFVELGFQSVQTYIQSGNVVFQHLKTGVKELETKIAKAITDKFGFDVPVISIELNELKEIIFNNPFVADTKKDIAYFHVTFLSEKPNQENLNKINANAYLHDEFHLVDRAIYLYCPNGYGNSKLSNGFFESKLKVTATTRNWKTINELEKIGELICR